MRVLVTGASGFVGSNLCWALRNVAEGRDRREWLAPLAGVEVLELRRDNAGELPALASRADAVMHLAGVNRSDDPDEPYLANKALAEGLVTALRDAGNPCPVLFASSVQASLGGRFADSAYGRGKLAAEDALLAHAQATGAPVTIWRLPGVFGRWCRPNYNSVVATFCHNAAHGMPLVVNDPSVGLDLLYVDDLVDAILRWLVGGSQGEPGPVAHVTVGELASMVDGLARARGSADVPDCTHASFAKDLASTFESYLPPQALSYALDAHADARGTFAELARSQAGGQASVLVCRPGQVRGNHWHRSKWERFLVVSGEALIRLRQVPHGGTQEGDVVECHVTGDELRVVEMPPGWAHSVRNPSADHDLVIVIWANEPFDPANPDTYSMEA